MSSFVLIMRVLGKASPGYRRQEWPAGTQTRSLSLTAHGTHHTLVLPTHLSHALSCIHTLTSTPQIHTSHTLSLTHTHTRAFTHSYIHTPSRAHACSSHTYTRIHPHTHPHTHSRTSVINAPPDTRLHTPSYSTHPRHVYTPHTHIPHTIHTHPHTHHSVPLQKGSMTSKLGSCSL